MIQLQQHCELLPCNTFEPLHFEPLPHLEALTIRSCCKLSIPSTLGSFDQLWGLYLFPYLEKHRRHPSFCRSVVVGFRHFPGSCKADRKQQNFHCGLSGTLLRRCLMHLISQPREQKRKKKKRLAAIAGIQRGAPW